MTCSVIEAPRPFLAGGKAGRSDSHCQISPRNIGRRATLTAITGSGSAQAPVAERPVALPPVIQPGSAIMADDLTYLARADHHIAAATQHILTQPHPLPPLAAPAPTLLAH